MIRRRLFLGSLSLFLLSGAAWAATADLTPASSASTQTPASSTSTAVSYPVSVSDTKNLQSHLYEVVYLHNKKVVFDAGIVATEGQPTTVNSTQTSTYIKSSFIDSKNPKIKYLTHGTFDTGVVLTLTPHGDVVTLKMDVSTLTSLQNFTAPDGQTIQLPEINHHFMKQNIKISSTNHDFLTVFKTGTDSNYAGGSDQYVLKIKRESDNTKKTPETVIKTASL